MGGFSWNSVPWLKSSSISNIHQQECGGWVSWVIRVEPWALGSSTQVLLLWWESHPVSRGSTPQGLPPVSWTPSATYLQISASFFKWHRFSSITSRGWGEDKKPFPGHQDVCCYNHRFLKFMAWGYTPIPIHFLLVNCFLILSLFISFFNYWERDCVLVLDSIIFIQIFSLSLWFL